jgi:hypothetical protein
MLRVVMLVAAAVRIVSTITETWGPKFEEFKVLVRMFFSGDHRLWDSIFGFNQRLSIAGGISVEFMYLKRGCSFSNCPRQLTDMPRNIEFRDPIILSPASGLPKNHIRTSRNLLV